MEWTFAPKEIWSITSQNTPVKRVGLAEPIHAREWADSITSSLLLCGVCFWRRNGAEARAESSNVSGSSLLD